MRKKYYNDELEFKVGSISLLSELIDKENRDAVLTMDVNEINNFVSYKSHVLMICIK